MKKAVIWILLLVMLAGTVACVPQETTPVATDAPGTPTENPEITPSPVAFEDATSALVYGNNAFAFDLYQELRQSEGNLFYSPYSISMALAMTYAGARGETARQMEDTLHFAPSDELLHSTFADLNTDITEPEKSVKVRTFGENGNYSDEWVAPYYLNIVNAIWGQKGYPFLAEYIDLVNTYYEDGLRAVDFSGAPEESRQEINLWASEKTEERIPELVLAGLIDSGTVMILVNAVYFKSDWKDKFEKQLTNEGIFYLLDKTEQTVPMMHQSSKFDYYQGAGFQAISLAYLGEVQSMVILLPDEGQFMDFEQGLDNEIMDAILQGMERRDVKLTLPRFGIESDFELKETLSEMGMPKAFSDADFSGIDGEKGLLLKDVIHKSFISVDEEGTEASAATVAHIWASIPLSPVEFTINRPFIFLIKDNETRSILFMGRVVDPQA
jgi:serpin B